MSRVSVDNQPSSFDEEEEDDDEFDDFDLLPLLTDCHITEEDEVNQNTDDDNDEQQLDNQRKGVRFSSEDNYDYNRINNMQNYHRKAPRPNLKVSLPMKIESNPRNSTKESEFLSNSCPVRITTKTPAVSKKWKNAFFKIRGGSYEDPWAKYNLDALETETAIRHRYNAVKKSWVCDDVLIKIEPESFAAGAMRQCYRMKKLSNFARSDNWKHASNYVAKHYIDNVDREVYFEDVKLQMDAKLWGEEYSRHNPPKKVDIIQMSVLEFKNRPGKPLYHLEHLIEGNYIKYNSNSGFVRDEAIRCTPQAFSHFTFERSSHQLIVVDIQGVGDLYTDPQIHTRKGEEYNDGNLGPKGMALFFHSHCCNRICESLGLTPFDLSAKEKEAQQHLNHLQSSAATMVRGSEELCHSPRVSGSIDMTDWITRHRSYSNSESVESPSSPDSMISPMSPASPDDVVMGSPPPSPLIHFRGRIRHDSDSATLTQEEDKAAFIANQVHRPSCVDIEVQLRQLMNMKRKTGGSILGQVHLEMAKYHELGRFCENEDERDMESALFHLNQAANCGSLESIIAVAHIYLQLPNDVLPEISVKESDENTNEGVDYMIMAAEAGDRSAMVHVAKAYDTGINLGTDRERSWREAVYWYENAVSTADEDDSGEYNAMMDSPNHQVIARQAEMYREGGFGLDKDPQKAGEMYNEAAESAMAAMKGRMANKYYMLAEECYGEMEEEEEDGAE
ncbi:LOW QUALITY PROTEIN: eukaryotic elongation factor 2 kinase-like [Ptychodera flava]|uniref:LOW QUALITY PROTEIN: eukaryotic elongation factor 2 kinase-like n=1 Tax=Ptychodera flava TaxID=63121 RepID=UPI00396A3DA7